MKRCCSGGGASACSAFDVLMRKLSKMSNKSGSDSVVAVALVGIFPFSFLLLTLLLWQVLPSLQLLLLGKDAATSSSNAVSIVCLSTWIWLLWDPFVFIFALQKPGVRRETKESINFFREKFLINYIHNVGHKCSINQLCSAVKGLSFEEDGRNHPISCQLIFVICTA